ncbi:Glycine receptor subunit alphaZ1 [Dirofilaria immitis]|nr:Glycine receptor subunit alphaZ1 [Dirofilaria immitis]
MREYSYDNGTIQESDQQLLRNNDVLSKNDSDAGVNGKNNFGVTSNETIENLLTNKLIKVGNYDSGDNFIDIEADDIPEILISPNINNSIENDSIIDIKLPILWINTTYQANDIGLNVTSLAECAVSNVSSLFNITDRSEDQVNITDNEIWTMHRGIEIITTKERLHELKLDENLLEKYQKIVIIFEEICKNYPRELWFSTVDDARQLGITKLDSFICDPFKEELYPSKEKLQQFEQFLNEIIANSTLNGLFKMPDDNITSETLNISETDEFHDLSSINNKDDLDNLDENSFVDIDEEYGEVVMKIIHNASDNIKNSKAPIVIKADASQQHIQMIIHNWEAIQALHLNIPKDIFERHQLIGLLLNGICADFVPSAIDEFNATEFEGVDIEGPIGLNITTLSLSGVNLTELAEKLRNDTEVDMILSRTMSENGTLGGSFILPVLQKNKYDPFSAPIVFQGSAVVVRFGIYIESMSNFQTSTMDYDMDIFLMMAWRDARLVNPYEKAILVKEEEILEKIWRPDPFLLMLKKLPFMKIKLKPSCNLVLCKYPHDRQTCELQIKSFAYPIKTVRFEWFSNKRDAIDKNSDVTLPELYIHRYEPTYCEKNRKSGHFSCLKAIFRLKRDVGFHIAQTYIPTSLALMFSWVGVWLPEEFMEGRIGVAITVLLTLSTESAGAREHLPSVSYMKAIDLWFGFITAFVFITLLQTLIVIALDKRAKQLHSRELMLVRAEQYHKRGRYLDNLCRLFYPIGFLIFLIAYYFVFTEGRQDDCVPNSRQN